MISVATPPLREIDARQRLDDALAANAQGRLAGTWLHEMGETMVQVSVDLTWPSLVKLIRNLQKEPLTLPSGWHLERVDPHNFHERAVALRHPDHPGGYAVGFRPGNHSWNYDGGIDRIACHAFSEGGGPTELDGDAPSLPDLLKACVASGRRSPGQVFQVSPSFEPGSRHEFRQTAFLRDRRVADGGLAATTVLAVLSEALDATGLGLEAREGADALLHLSYHHFATERAATVEAACGSVAADRGLIGSACHATLEGYALRALAHDFGRRWPAEPRLDELLRDLGATSRATRFTRSDGKATAWVEAGAQGPCLVLDTPRSRTAVEWTEDEVSLLRLDDEVPFPIARLRETAVGLEVLDHGPVDNLTIRDANALLLTFEAVQDCLIEDLGRVIETSPSP